MISCFPVKKFGDTQRKRIELETGMSNTSPSITVPDEGYLKRREEIIRQDETKARESRKKASFAAAINRFLEDGISEYTKHDLGAWGEEDWQNIKATLADWKYRGLTRIVKPIDEAEDRDVVIEMLKYVDTEDGFKWPAFPLSQHDCCNSCSFSVAAWE